MDIDDAAEFLINYAAPHYHWPHVDKSVSDAIVSQAGRSLSDQTAAGIIGEFERAFSNHLGVDYVVAYSSGTAALHSMVKIARLQPEDEVIVGAYGFFASASPFAYEGVRIRFVDVDSRGNIDATAAEAAITPKTRAIMCVHMWGNPCDMPRFREICDKHDLWLFEDCAHAHFARVARKPVGVLSDLASFSFNQKALTAGEAGALVCRNRELYEAALLFGHYNKRCFAEVSPSNPDFKYSITGYGLKYRPHTLAMALGLHQISIAEEIRERRRGVVEAFEAAVKEHPHLEVLSPNVQNGELGLYVLPLRIRSVPNSRDYRNRLVQWAHSKGAAQLDIPGSTTLMNGFALFNNASNETSFPIADSFDGQIMKLPLWGYVGDEEIVEAYCRIIESSAEYVNADR